MTFGNAAAPGASNERATYRRIAELGRGGMATVHLAAMQGPHGVTKLVVIKELRPELAMNDEFVVMFFDEARLAARLNHPNIVQSYEVGEENGRQFIVMEYLEGQPLHRVWNKLQSSGKMTVDVNLQVVSDVLSGLDYAHELANFNGSALNIVHRDVSPHNVFVTYTGDVKVVDFGIAKAADSSTQTRVGTLKGKLTYMPPEQAMGEKVDRRADIFAVGVLLWESSAGRPFVARLERRRDHARADDGRNSLAFVGKSRPSAASRRNRPQGARSQTRQSLRDRARVPGRRREIDVRDRRTTFTS